MTYALDTNAFSDFQRNTHWVKEISEAEHISFSTIVIGELKYGFRAGHQFSHNLDLLEEFLSYECVTIAQVDLATCDVYASLKYDLRKAGKPIPENDIWIASSCIAQQATLLTRDRHFLRIPQLSVLFS